MAMESASGVVVPGAGRACVDCLPTRKGHCMNTNSSSTPAAVPSSLPPLSNDTDVDAMSPASLDDSTSVQSKNMASDVSELSRALNFSVSSPLAPRSLSFNDANASLSHDLAHGSESTPLHAQDLSLPTSPNCPETMATALPTLESFELPPFRPLNPISEFTWGSVDGATFIDQVDNAYDTVVNWRRNIFGLPYGNIGKDFVSELSRLFRDYANDSALEAIALKAAMIMPPLLLQNPAFSKQKENIKCLEWRLLLWRDGNISALLKEGQSIQDRLKLPSAGSINSDKCTQTFGKLVFKGKIKEAIRMLDDCPTGGVLLPILMFVMIMESLYVIVF